MGDNMNWDLFFQLNADFIQWFAYGSIFMLLVAGIITIFAVMKHENGKYTEYLEDVYSGQYTGE